MAIVDRIKRICLQPKSEWEVIAAEDTAPPALYRGYVVPLTAIPAIAGFIGGSLVGQSLPFVGRFRVPLVTGLVTAVFGFVMALVGIFVLSLIINALAPSFGGEKSSTQALKVAAYSYTPAWIAGVLQIIPSLGLLAVLAGLYGIYLLYLGLPRLMKCPADKAIGYTAVVVLSAIVLSAVIGFAGNAIIRLGMVGVPRGADVPASVKFDKDSPMGKLQAMGEAMEESRKKMEAAKKSGDPKAQAAAAMAGLGALMGGGKRFDPLGVDQLKPLLPEKLGGLDRKSSKAEKTGIVGMMVSKASASYGDGARQSIALDISDTGGAAGLMGLAAWVNVQGEKEDDDGFERTQNLNGRWIREKGSKRGGSNEYTVVVGNRFVVSAKGHGVELNAIKAAVATLDLAKLEALKNAGALE